MLKIFFKNSLLASNRQALSFFVIAIASVIVFSSCYLFENKPITVAAHVWPGYEPMFLARNEGWLDGGQVSLLETVSAMDSIQALMDHKAQVAALTLDETLKARSMGLPLTIVMVFNTSAGADMLVADKSIKTLSDLKGKRLARDTSSLADVMLANILELANLSEQQVTLVEVPINKQRDAWLHKRADAFISYEPVATQLLTNSMHKLFDSRQIPNTIVDVMVVRNDVIERRHANAIRHLISAHFRALQHLKHNPQDTAYRVAEHLGIAAHEVLAAYKGLLLPDAENNHRLLDGGDDSLLLESARHLSALMLQHKLIEQHDNLTKLIDTRYLPMNFWTTDD